MESYLSHVVSNLTIHDMKVMATLANLEATAIFKSVKKNYLLEKSGLSEFKFRKSLERLDAVRFITIVKDGKNHRICITNFGQLALNQNLEGEC